VRERHGEAAVGAAAVQVEVVELGVDGPGRTEQPQHLVDQVAAQVAEQPGVRADLQGGRVGLLHPGLDAPQLTQLPTPQDGGQGADVGVPTAVVEHVQRNPRVPGRGHQLAAARRVGGERLVGDRRHARRDGLQHQRAAGLRRGGDGHRVDPGGQQLGQRVVGGHRGEVRGQLGAPVRRAGDHAGQLHVLRRGNERGVEVAAADPVSDQSEPHG
jgi:hypothetical protein